MTVGSVAVSVQMYECTCCVTVYSVAVSVKVCNVAVSVKLYEALAV